MSTVKPVPGHPNYLVDTDGNVYNAQTKRQLAVHRGQRVFVSVNGTPTPIKLARLVLTAFCGEPEPWQAPCWLNGHPWDNHLSNLCWWPTTKPPERLLIPGFGNYEADTEGRIYSLISGKSLMPQTMNCKVFLYRGDDRSWERVDELVLRTFRGWPQLGQIPHHWGDEHDNRLDNLCWWPPAPGESTPIPPATALEKEPREYLIAELPIYIVVTDRGEVRNTLDGTTYPPIPGPDGRLNVSVDTGYKIVTRDLADLVLSCSGQRPPLSSGPMHAAHRDDNKANNRLDNLYWELSI